MLHDIVADQHQLAAQPVDRADRGGAWSDYLVSTRERTGEVVGELFPDLVDPEAHPVGGPSGAPVVDLLDFDPDGEDKVIAAIVAPRTSRPEAEAIAAGEAATRSCRN